MPSNSYYNLIDVMDFNADPPVWLPSLTMTLARSHLASVSFIDSILFAGGKNETGLVNPIVYPNDQVDYFLDGAIVDTNQRLSKPRFDLSGAGLSILLDQTVFNYAVFVGGSDANKNVLDTIDVWTVAGDRDPNVFFTNLRQKRTAPTVAVIARATSRPIIVITGGDSENVAGCQPAPTAEFIIVDPAAADPSLRVSSTTQMVVNGVSVAACDTATASSEMWILQAGGQLSTSVNSTANVVAFCWGSCPPLPPGPTPPSPNVSPDTSAPGLPPGTQAALAIFFITYFANIAGVVFYCREKAINMPIPLASAFLGWILSWIIILFVLPERDKRKLAERAGLQNRML